MSEAVAARALDSRIARSKRGTLTAAPITLRSGWSISVTGVDTLATGAEIAIDAASTVPANWSKGSTFRLEVAAKVTAIRSFAAGTGELQPNTASPADHGVRRSTCARIMPWRKSAALFGKSS